MHGCLLLMSEYEVISEAREMEPCDCFELLLFPGYAHMLICSNCFAGALRLISIFISHYHFRDSSKAFCFSGLGNFITPF
ncbi:hypothetical protein SLA2020_024200 [Shorea laevis]